MIYRPPARIRPFDRGACRYHQRSYDAIEEHREECAAIVAHFFECFTFFAERASRALPARFQRLRRHSLGWSDCEYAGFWDLFEFQGARLSPAVGKNGETLLMPSLFSKLSPIFTELQDLSASPTRKRLSLVRISLCNKDFIQTHQVSRRRVNVLELRTHSTIRNIRQPLHIYET